MDPISSQPLDGDARVSLTLTELKDLLARQQSGGITATDLKSALEAVTVGMQKALKPENITSPQQSVFNPLGDRDYPRPEFRAPVHINGMRVDPELHTWEEIELINRLPRGSAFVTKANGQKIKFTVVYVLSETDQLERITISYPCRFEEQRTDHAPLMSYLLEYLRAMGVDTLPFIVFQQRMDDARLSKPPVNPTPVLDALAALPAYA